MGMKKELEDLRDELKKFIPELKNQKARERAIAEFDTEVKEWGSSAHIPIQRKFVGHKARVIISHDKIKEEDRKDK